MKPTPLPWRAEDTLVLGPHMEFICDCGPPDDFKFVNAAMEKHLTDLGKANAAFIAETVNAAAFPRQGDR